MNSDPLQNGYVVLKVMSQEDRLDRTVTSSETGWALLALLSFVIILIIVLVIIIIVVVISYELRDWPQINEGNSRNLSLCKTRCFVIQLFHTYL